MEKGGETRGAKLTGQSTLARERECRYNGQRRGRRPFQTRGAVAVLEDAKQKRRGRCEVQAMRSLRSVSEEVANKQKRTSRCKTL